MLVKRIVEHDRRQYPRFPQLLELRAREVQPLGSVIEPEKAVVGLSEIPFSIPTLMQVRWTRKKSLQADTYLTGLQFLL